MITEGCDFCLEVRVPIPGSRSNVLSRLLDASVQDDYLLHRTDHMGVLPSIGALTPGHLLICPVRHVSATAQLSDVEFADMTALTNRYRVLLTRTFGAEVVVYEHGPGELSSAGACVDHAHVHLLPLERAREMRPLTPVQWNPIGANAKATLMAMSTHGYLWLSDPDGTWVCSGEQVRSQELRRTASALLGDPDRWDWAVWPQVDNLRATIEAVRAAEAPAVDEDRGLARAAVRRD